MPTARDKLIADWQSRLIAAQATDPSLTTRTGWLARMQVRLYQFLLSLYGDGAWTADSPAIRSPADATKSLSDCVVIDAPDMLPLAGKPAKSIGKIQAVLKSVCAAQDHSPQAGPLAQGLTADCWVTVALMFHKKWSRIAASAAALRQHGIENRLQLLGRRYSLEVRAADRQQAMRVIAAQPRPATAANRRPQSAWLQFRPTPFAAPAYAVAALFGPLAGLLVVWWLSGWFSDRWIGMDGSVFLTVLAAIWIAVAAAVAALIVSVVPLVQTIPEILFRIKIRRQSFATRDLTLGQFSREVLWHCFA